MFLFKAAVLKFDTGKLFITKSILNTKKVHQFCCKLRNRICEEMSELQIAQCLAFDALSREEQMDVLQKEGVYIGKLKEGEGTRLLYQYQSIYVEVCYEVYRKHIREVHCFVDTAILDRYIMSEGFDKTH